MANRILMVDDEPHNLDILRIFLKSLKYEVFEATCGTEALIMVEQVSPDVILLDIMMPDISGYDICKQLKEKENCQIPIIFLSANAQKEAIERGLHLGAFDYLTKPFDLDLIEKKLENAIRQTQGC